MKSFSFENLNTKRTIRSLLNTLLNLLKTKAFENITVRDLCSESLIARGTFYNYFEDKYDLLNYFWQSLTIEIDPIPSIANNFPNTLILTSEEYLETFIEKYVEFFDLNRDDLNKILMHNALPSSYLIISCRIYLNDYIFHKLKTCNNFLEFEIPQALAAQHFTNSILSILEWKYIYRNNATKEELIKYLRILIKGPTPILK